MSAELSALLLPMVERVGWGIVHSCWLGVICALLLAFTVRFMRSAAARHLACMLALVATLGSTVVISAQMSLSSAGLAPQTVPAKEANRQRSAPRSKETVTIDQRAADRLSIDRAVASAAAPPPRSAAMMALFHSPHFIAPLLPWLTMSWLMGVVFLSLRHFAGWRRVRAWRRSGTSVVHAASQRLASEIRSKLRLRLVVPIMESAEVLTPIVVGTIRPIVLLPLRLITGFRPSELEAILAHELAHIARGDTWANLLQVVCETALFYHPAVWWMSRRARIERENAADDLATAVCSDRLQYATALARLAEEATSPQIVLAANDGVLLARIRRLLIPKSQETNNGWATGGLMLSALLCATFLVIDNPSKAIAAEAAKIAQATVAVGQTAADPSKETEKPAQKAAAVDVKRWLEDVFQLEDKGKREAAIEGIRAAMTSGNAEEARAGVKAFVQLGAIEFDKASFRPAVRALLGSTDAPTRAAAASALTMTGAEAADVERVLSLVDDPAPEVREHLSWIIFQLHKGDLTGAGGDAVLKLLASTERNQLREGLRGIWGAKISLPLEARVVELSQNLETTNGVAYDAMYFALSTQANKSAASVRRLIELLSHQDTTNVAGRCAWGLQQGVSPAEFPLVADAMVKVIEARSDGYLRNNALRCLRTYGDARNSPALKTLLAKPGVTGEFRKLLEETVSSLDRRVVETRGVAEPASVVVSTTATPVVTKNVAPPAVSAPSSATAAETPEIEVEWRGKWWPAKVVKKEGDMTLIHYVGFGSEWDETVPANRIRPIQVQNAQQSNEIARDAELVEQNRRAARLRAAEDRRHYSPEQLQEIETLYQVANTKGKRDAEAKASLKQLLEKYDKANRTGCATLYLGQASIGAERLEYLTRAVEKFSDCYYFNGCQVGGYGRYVLAMTLWEKGEKEKARQLLAELKTKYKDATDHGGRPMGKVAEAVEKELAKQP